MRQATPVQRRAESPAARLVEFQGHLVPIEELAPDLEADRADSPRMVKVIDLTDKSADDVLVVDMVQEEEDQAAHARMSGEETFHTEIERAQADTSPEYPSGD